MLAFAQVTGQPAHAHHTPKPVIDYLAQRGIDVTLAAQLGLKILPAADLFTQARGTPPTHPDDRWAIVFPHHSPLGFEVDWWSARLVQPAPDPKPAGLRVVHSFAEVTEQRQLGGKMFCPPNTPPAAYLPVAEGLPAWDSIPRGSRIYLHESVIKAVNGAVLGTYSVGLNGVWGWGSRKHNIALLPELRDIPWKALDLQPVILFDTNIDSSQQVNLAAKRLAEKLLEVTGKHAKLLRMPHQQGDEFGFDDFVQRVGVDEARLFLSDTELEDIDVSETELLLLELNQEVAVVRSLSRVAEIKTGNLMSTGAFTELVYAHYQAETVDANGNTKFVSVPKLWLKDPRKTQVESLVYAPGQPVLAGGNLNTWRGMGVDPAPGNVEGWLQLLSNNLQDVELQDWVLDWLAYPLQNPGGKLNTLLLIFGPSGTGKDMFLSPIHVIYGENGVTIGSDELRSSFTSIYAAKQFIHADELKRVANAADAVNQKIKALVTQPTLTVNRKGDPEYKIKNVANLAITSNYYDCVKLDEDDRRAAIIRWSPINDACDMRGVQEYWSPLAAWLQSKEGAAAVYDYLLNRDLTHFNPAAWAPGTVWKGEVIDAARSPIERFVAQLRTDPQLHLPPLTDGRCLFTSKELATYHYGEDPAKGQTDALANELRNQNFQKANGDKSIRSKSGVNRWWVVPRPDVPAQDWQRADVCSQHLKAHGL